MKEILSHLLADAEARSLVSDSFPKMHISNKINISVKAMCRVAAKKLLNKALQICWEHAGSLLQAARLVQSMELTEKNDFGDGCHMESTEPFFYDSAYKLVKKEYALPIDTNGRCNTAKNVCTSNEIPRCTDALTKVCALCLLCFLCSVDSSRWFTWVVRVGAPSKILKPHSQISRLGMWIIC